MSKPKERKTGNRTARGFNRKKARQVDNWGRLTEFNEYLYQQNGKFFLLVESVIRKGSMYGEEENRKTVHERQEVVSMTEREALVWSIKRHIPETFRGYVLECLPQH